MKSVLMIVNYFHPDVASTSQLLSEMCEALESRFNITVICAIPSYTGFEKSKWNKVLNHDRYCNRVKVVRVKVPNVDKARKYSRVKYIISYFFIALYAALRTKKTDIVFSISQPPILGGLLGSIVKLFKRNRFIYCIEDFNPEQIEAVGYSHNRYLLNFARYLDNISCNYADKVVVLGKDMQETLLRRNKKFDINKSVIINNWVNEKEIYPLSKENTEVHSFLQQHNLIGKYIIMYSGNMGLYYDLENLIRVFSTFKNYKDVVFVFIGEGAKKEELVEYVKENHVSNIIFLPYQSKENLIYSLNAANLHIVANAKGIKGVSVPSKIYGVMAVGKPILGILEDGSEAQFLIEKSDCGLVVEPGQYKKIGVALEKIINERNGFMYKGLSGRKYLERNLSMGKAVDNYADIFIGL